MLENKKLVCDIWREAEEYLLKDDETKFLLERAGNIEDCEPTKRYMQMWKEISYDVQSQKAKNHNLSLQEKAECFKSLSRRPYYLAKLAEEFKVSNIAEVGTAEGLQFYSFAEYASNSYNWPPGHVWSCDIRDVRNRVYIEKYSNNSTFVPGTSAALAKELKKNDIKIDLFYIDADHRKGAIIHDVANLRKFQTENTIWIFDDFDKRFGCYEDIQMLCKVNKKFKIYRVGNAASGNPNHQVIIFGKI
jgi:hypothetical protein